ncbi:hypothetical protein LP419_06850 [Massilia sp. H-1]|nr:hypothetical protein LP419_06850 [Massilia sp. H-1]
MRFSLCALGLQASQLGGGAQLADARFGGGRFFGRFHFHLFHQGARGVALGALRFFGAALGVGLAPQQRGLGLVGVGARGGGGGQFVLGLALLFQAHQRGLFGPRVRQFGFIRQGRLARFWAASSGAAARQFGLFGGAGQQGLRGIVFGAGRAAAAAAASRVRSSAMARAQLLLHLERGGGGGRFIGQLAFLGCLGGERFGVDPGLDHRA